MESSTLSLSSSSIIGNNNNKQIEDEYKLTLKHFKNKQLIKSFKLIYKLYKQSFNQFNNQLITEQLFIKIINLYLIEIGVLLKQQPQDEDKYQCTIAINSITSNELYNQLIMIYGEEFIPNEILYNYHLMLITNYQLLINDKLNYLQDLNQIINRQSNTSNDKYLNKLINLIVFEILPTFDEFKLAESIINSSNIFNEQSLIKLNEIKQNKQNILKQQQQEEQQQQKQQQQEQELLKQHQEQQQKQQNLKYKSLKEIQKQYQSQTSDGSSSIIKNIEKSPIEVNKLHQLSNKLKYLINLLKVYIKDNSLIIIIIIISSLIISKFIKLNRTNIKQKLLDTIKMAFKFSYI
ncbi:uncharacterized protein J8A68_000944 [[Candida] subhashii]|uniref:Transmembrane protein n=1 Tax=[Candida] subhashii TaxID=561895 RepID=A0A8J5QVK0_9ASCO|nr:uncharacterized protein J8A68_000944 [[Candida] subhashii]KAG7665542.1 hypothetical protein J8A68_000944 [[Candida] subhashii]